MIQGRYIDPWFFLAGLSAIELIVILIALFMYLSKYFDYMKLDHN